MRCAIALQNLQIKQAVFDTRRGDDKYKIFVRTSEEETMKYEAE
jgi:hypothetical protein